uniref:RING-type domain-containing protein n=1 Tax=Neogobius melanostomus TaxID=47308 RepID=A0A8C6URV1_9GOBI
GHKHTRLEQRRDGHTSILIKPLKLYFLLSAGMASVSCVLSEDQFLCSICLEVFTDPVTTPCGHSFCNICINKHWDNCDHCHCPVCKEEFSSRPKLKTNTFMLEMVSEFKTKPQKEDTESLESDSTGAGDVLCDISYYHSHFMCLQCSYSDHKSHNTVPLKEQCEEEQSELQQKIQERKQKIQEQFVEIHSFCLYTNKLILT